MNTKKDFKSLSTDNIINNWEACLERGFKKILLVACSPPRDNMLKFNVDGVAGGKLGPTGVCVSFKNDVDGAFNVSEGCMNQKFKCGQSVCCF